MHVVHGYASVPAAARNGVVAIGNFDGVHNGHRALLGRAIGIARAAGAAAGAVLFEPHPRAFFAPQAPHFRLTGLPFKLRLLDEVGLDFAVVLNFDAALAGLSAADFIDTVLVKSLAVRHVVVGWDFRFGHKRSGDAALMRAAGLENGFEITVIEPVMAGGAVYSSSAVRAALEQGDVTAAARLLGYPWRVVGTVTAGSQRGTGLGFPTANIALPDGTRLGHGIYAVRIIIAGQAHEGAAYLGTRPTFDDGGPVLEVFVFDYAGDLYGQEIEVEFVVFLRGDQRFDSAEALTAQMHSDCAAARAVLRGTAAAGPAGARTANR